MERFTFIKREKSHELASLPNPNADFRANVLEQSVTLCYCRRPFDIGTRTAMVKLMFRCKGVEQTAANPRLVKATIKLHGDHLSYSEA